LRYGYDSGRGVTGVAVDSNGDGTADFAVDLAGNKTLTAADFTSSSLLLPLTMPGTSGSDVLTGGALGDTLQGVGGNDTLYGGLGHDTVDGGAGVDLLYGGSGNDLYVVDNVGDVVTEPAASFTAPSGWVLKGTHDYSGDGVQDAVVSQGGTNQLWVLSSVGSVIETVSLPDYSGLGWSFLGIADQDGDGTPDLLYNRQSQWGSHPMVGTTVGAAGGATVHVPLPLSGADVDTVQASIGYTLGANLENLTLASGAGSIDGTGNGLSNVIVGNESGNRLLGGGGADTLTGGGGADTFVFDAMVGGSGTDIITDFSSGDSIFAGANTVDAGLGTATVLLHDGTTIIAGNGHLWISADFF